MRTEFHNPQHLIEPMTQIVIYYLRTVVVRRVAITELVNIHHHALLLHRITPLI